MTPYEAVREEFDFPFGLYPFQIEETNELCPFERVGFYWEPGTGKTAGSTHWALYHSMTQGVEHWIVVMPPILLQQWARWLTSVKVKSSGEPLSVTIYAGTPAKRRDLNMEVDFILVSYGLFKNDFDRFQKFTHGRSVGMIADEGHALKNIQSQTHKSVKELVDGRHLAILTGTPLTTPADAYAYVKLIAPVIYRNLRQFENLHIKERDDYDKVVAWDNLELLAANMKVQTSRVIRRDVVKDLPAVTYTTLVYDLEPAHAKLYKRIADEKLVELEGGGEINAISVQAMYSALQQVIINWAHFQEDESLEPACLGLIDEIFDEIGPNAKLAVVANFIRSNRYLVEKLAKYGVVALYGDITPANKQKAIARFIDDPACRCILLQPASAGFGVDGLQHVCSDMLVLEAPTVSPPFDQVVKRLDRDGQKSPVNCRVAIANGTVQVRMFKSLLENDATVNAIQGGYDLRDAIYGK